MFWSIILTSQTGFVSEGEGYDMRGGQSVTVKSELYQIDIKFHKSKKGLIDALGENYGEFQKLQITKGVAILSVPKIDMGGWIGKGGCVVGALKEILGVDKVKVVGLEPE
ncbi:MAG: hypothetical protein Q8Q05_03230 [bacterium]|nr:hypothetical protein [bacterium]